MNNHQKFIQDVIKSNKLMDEALKLIAQELLSIKKQQEIINNIWLELEQELRLKYGDYKPEDVIEGK